MRGTHNRAADRNGLMLSGDAQIVFVFSLHFEDYNVILIILNENFDI